MPKIFKISFFTLICLIMVGCPASKVYEYRNISIKDNFSKRLDVRLIQNFLYKENHLFVSIYPVEDTLSMYIHSKAYGNLTEKLFKGDTIIYRKQLPKKANTKKDTVVVEYNDLKYVFVKE